MTCTPPPGLLELSPVERGVVSIFGVASRFFVAMSSRGKLYGSVSTAGRRAAGQDRDASRPSTPGSWNFRGSDGVPGWKVTLSKALRRFR